MGQMTSLNPEFTFGGLKICHSFNMDQKIWLKKTIHTFWKFMVSG